MMSLTDIELVRSILKQKSIPFSELEKELNNYVLTDNRKFSPEMTADLIVCKYNQNKTYNSIKLSPLPTLLKMMTPQVYN